MAERPNRCDAREAFLAALIDDAGLFPPARLPMDEAVASHVASKGGSYAWMMGRFLCPASRLPELAERLPETSDEEPWRVGVIMDGAGDAELWHEGIARDLGAARDFAARCPAVMIELLEARLPVGLVEGGDEAALATEVRGFMYRVQESGLRQRTTPFFEVPLGSTWQRSVRTAIGALSAVREAMPSGIELCGAPGAKLRCGGLSADAFPSPEQVSAFVSACTLRGVPFKATAGLHHPFRHVDADTGFVQHGFLNLVGASILACTHNLPQADLTGIVADEDPDDFSLTREGFRWRDLEADADSIGRARERSFTAYGSCSFAEPVEDLLALGVLPVVV